MEIEPHLLRVIIITPDNKFLLRNKFGTFEVAELRNLRDGGRLINPYMSGIMASFEDPEEVIQDINFLLSNRK